MLGQLQAEEECEVAGDDELGSVAMGFERFKFHTNILLVSCVTVVSGLVLTREPYPVTGLVSSYMQ